MLLCGEWDVFPILTCTWLRFVLRADHILTAFLQQTETLPLSPRPHPYLSNATPSSSTKASLSTRRVILNVQQSLPKRARGLFSSLLLLSRFSCVRPHRWQPTRGPRPWDSPGKNTGAGCHFLLQCMRVKSESEVAQSCTNLDCILKSRDITLPTMTHLVKAMVFPVVMYGCESWTIKKTKH